MPINTKLLRKIEKYITEEPRRLNMSQWGGIFDPDNERIGAQVCRFESNSGRIEAKVEDLPPCGSVGCIAGTAWLLNQTPEQLEKYKQFQGQDLMGYEFYRLPSSGVSDYATEALGLDEDEANRLFYVPGVHDVKTGWPDKFAKRYIKAKTPKQRAKVTVERIEHFIKTKGAE